MNKYFVDYLAKYNKERYIDTSTLMNVDSLNLYISKVKDQLVKNNIKLIVCAPVMEELIKHTKLSNRIKRVLAKEAIDIIESNKDIFVVEDANSDNSSLTTFADKSLLSIIISRRCSRSVMLITNDKNLAMDALDMKNLKSVNGGAVYVTYIDCNGEQQDWNADSVEDVVEEIKNNEESINNSKSPLLKELFNKSMIPLALGTATAIILNVFGNDIAKGIVKNYFHKY